MENLVDARCRLFPAELEPFFQHEYRSSAATKVLEQVTPKKLSSVYYLDDRVCIIVQGLLLSNIRMK